MSRTLGSLGLLIVCLALRLTAATVATTRLSLDAVPGMPVLRELTAEGVAKGQQKRGSGVAGAACIARGGRVSASRAEMPAGCRSGRGAGAGIAFLELIGLRLLQLLFGHVEGQAVVAGLDLAQPDRDVLAAHPEERADVEHHRCDPAVAIENDILDAADVLVLRVVDGAAKHLAGAELIGLDRIRRGVRLGSRRRRGHRLSEGRCAEGKQYRQRRAGGRLVHGRSPELITPPPVTEGRFGSFRRRPRTASRRPARLFAPARPVAAERGRLRQPHLPEEAVLDAGSRCLPRAAAGSRHPAAMLGPVTGTLPLRQNLSDERREALRTAAPTLQLGAP